MSALSTAPHCLVAGPLRELRGFVRGRRQLSMLVSLRLHESLVTSFHTAPTAAQFHTLHAAWQSATGVECPALQRTDNQDMDWHSAVTFAAHGAFALLQQASVPVMEPPVLLSLAPKDQEHAAWTRLLLPVVPAHAPATQQAWLLTLQLIHAHLTHGLAQTPDLLHQAHEKLRRLAPQSSNTPRFLRAAYSLNIPVTAIGQDIFQYGHGHKSQWFNSTFTDQTSNLSTKLARNKLATAARLRQAGLPVPEHHMASNADHAVAIAHRLGFPVVVKPLDLDGGSGVSAHLDNDEEVRAAFHTAQALSPHTLVEKHFFGRDYRLTVMDGQLLWSIERIPAGVTGDGQNTITQRVHQENLNPRRALGKHSALQPLVLDATALKVLHKQGLTPDSIPFAGQFAALRSIANVASGGQPVAVNAHVHPDNARLAIRAAQALRLDMAGIDLLIPDISQSWHTSGAALCEVNAQPQLGFTTGPHLYGDILSHRLMGNGRIPVVVILGEDGQTLTLNLAADLHAQGFCVGWSHPQDAGVDEERIIPAPHSTFDAAQMLLTDPRVHILVLHVDGQDVLQQGSPVDRVDWLVVGNNTQALGDSTRTSTPQTLMLRLLLPACSGKLIHWGDPSTQHPVPHGLVAPGCTIHTMTRQMLASDITHALNP